MLIEVCSGFSQLFFLFGSQTLRKIFATKLKLYLSSVTRDLSIFQTYPSALSGVDVGGRRARVRQRVRENVHLEISRAICKENIIQH